MTDMSGGAGDDVRVLPACMSFRLNWLYSPFCRDFMAESGAIGGRTDISSSKYAHKFNPKCFLPCLTNGMDAFGDSDTPSYLYRRSAMGESIVLLLDDG